MIQLELFAQEPDQAPEVHDLQELFHRLNHRHWNGRLPFFRCEWSDRMITTWGACYRHRNLIRISSLFKRRPLRELEALLCHEMIHVRYRGHGARFRGELRRLGLEGDVQKLFPHLNDLTSSLRRPLRYTYECASCKTQIQRRRRVKGYCAACHAGGIRSRFRLIK